jgi:hypothetical protein
MARLIALFICPLIWAFNLRMALLQTFITFKCFLPWVNFTFVVSLYIMLLYLSYNFLYKNQPDSFTIFPGLCREVYLTGQYSFQLFDRHLHASKVRDLKLVAKYLLILIIILLILFSI